jgi:hypothetical protein
MVHLLWTAALKRKRTSQNGVTQAGSLSQEESNYTNSHPLCQHAIKMISRNIVAISECSVHITVT